MHAGPAPCKNRPSGLPVLIDKPQDELENLISFVGQLHEEAYYLLPYKIFGWDTDATQKSYWEVEDILSKGPVNSWLNKKLQRISKNKKEKKHGC